MSGMYRGSKTFIRGVGLLVLLLAFVNTVDAQLVFPAFMEKKSTPVFERPNDELIGKKVQGVLATVQLLPLSLQELAGDYDCLPSINDVSLDNVLQCDTLLVHLDFSDQVAIYPEDKLERYEELIEPRGDGFSNRVLRRRNRKIKRWRKRKARQIRRYANKEFVNGASQRAAMVREVVVYNEIIKAYCIKTKEMNCLLEMWSELANHEQCTDTLILFQEELGVDREYVHYLLSVDSFMREEDFDLLCPNYKLGDYYHHEKLVQDRLKSIERDVALKTCMTPAEYQMHRGQLDTLLIEAERIHSRYIKHYGSLKEDCSFPIKAGLEADERTYKADVRATAQQVKLIRNFTIMDVRKSFEGRESDQHHELLSFQMSYENLAAELNELGLNLIRQCARLIPLLKLKPLETQQNLQALQTASLSIN